MGLWFTAERGEGRGDGFPKEEKIKWEMSKKENRSDQWAPVIYNTKNLMNEPNEFIKTEKQ